MKKTSDHPASFTNKFVHDDDDDDDNDDDYDDYDDYDNDDDDDDDDGDERNCFASEQESVQTRRKATKFSMHKRPTGRLAEGYAQLNYLSLFHQSLAQNGLKPTRAIRSREPRPTKQGEFMGYMITP